MNVEVNLDLVLLLALTSRIIYSLVPRLLPVFQCCTLKNGKPGKIHHVNDVEGIQLEYIIYQAFLIFSVQH